MAPDKLVFFYSILQFVFHRFVLALFVNFEHKPKRTLQSSLTNKCKACVSHICSVVYTYAMLSVNTLKAMILCTAPTRISTAVPQYILLCFPSVFEFINCKLRCNIKLSYLHGLYLFFFNLQGTLSNFLSRQVGYSTIDHTDWSYTVLK